MLSGVGRARSNARAAFHLQFAFTPEALGWSLDQTFGKSGSGLGRVRQSRSDLTAHFQNSGLPKEVFGRPATKTIA
jgi:hypothetical protein